MTKREFKNYPYFFLIFLNFILIFFLVISPAKADDFNPNYIISDDEVLDYSSMTMEDIKEFLINKNSGLATYYNANPDGKLMSAAEIIYDRAVTNKVNPKFILVLLQKEQSLIEDPGPSPSHLDWAAGYGCPDSAPCSPRWKGFWKQVNSASLQFRDYMDNPQLYTYKSGTTYTLSNPYGVVSKDPMVVTPVNQATAALYNYTPHVYNGNYNFYKIWQRYFTRSYIDGSLLQAENDPGVWLIQNGKKRPIVSKGALLSRFDINKIIKVGKADLDKYERGAPIKFPEYSLIRSPQGMIYLLTGEKKRAFADSVSFKRLGFNSAEITGASWEDVNSYADGSLITATSTYPTGALLQDKKKGGVYWVADGKKAPILDKIILKTIFKNKKIIPVSTEELLAYETTDPVKFDDGELLKTNNSATIYVISNGKKRPIYSGKIFEQFGYKWQNIITVSSKILYLYDQGDPLTSASSVTSGNITSTGSSTNAKLASNIHA